MDGDEGLLLKVNTTQKIFAQQKLMKSQGRYLPLRARTKIRFPRKLWELELRCWDLESVCYVTSCEGTMQSGLRRGDRGGETEGEGYG